MTFSIPRTSRSITGKTPCNPTSCVLKPTSFYTEDYNTNDLIIIVTRRKKNLIGDDHPIIKIPVWLTIFNKDNSSRSGKVGNESKITLKVHSYYSITTKDWKDTHIKSCLVNVYKEPSKKKYYTKYDLNHSDEVS